MMLSSLRLARGSVGGLEPKCSNRMLKSTRSTQQSALMSPIGDIQLGVGVGLGSGVGVREGVGVCVGVADGVGGSWVGVAVGQGEVQPSPK